MGMTGNYKMATLEEITQLYNKEISTPDFLYHNNNNDNYLDIDKTWHILKYILTGESWENFGEDYDYIVPINDKTLILNDVNMGFGSAMFIPVDKISKAYAYMDNISKENFKKNISINDMLENEIYPIQDKDDIKEIFNYVYPYFLELKKFFEKAYNQDKYIIFWIS